MQLYISVFAAAVSLLALAFSVLTYIIGLRRQRKQATLDAYNTLQKEALDKLNKEDRSPNHTWEQFLEHFREQGGKKQDKTIPSRTSFPWYCTN